MFLIDQTCPNLSKLVSNVFNRPNLFKTCLKRNLIFSRSFIKVLGRPIPSPLLNVLVNFLPIYSAEKRLNEDVSTLRLKASQAQPSGLRLGPTLIFEQWKKFTQMGTLIRKSPGAHTSLYFLGWTSVEIQNGWGIFQKEQSCFRSSGFSRKLWDIQMQSINCKTFQAIRNLKLKLP